ncbi:peptidase C69 [Thermus thermophilus]|uniref:Peptidase C69 n=1 Tax=Thermus thermophilus TaxID=274 RepID=A0AAD1KUQ8_THETH|nr:metallopeptidase TldD-related protein [Thermus thermophilus]BCZ86670.1 peptidase C69 [Thermus thermophilus]BCZ89052.1 peptidase C69 [Thermus thermophilus]BCZ91683.1 peptidase C69 [Thermus thermophilus]
MTLEEAKAYVLKRARELGVEVELLFEEERELSLRAREGRLEEITEARQGGLGLRVVAEGKVGYAYTEELSPEALDWALEEARENALLAAKEGALPQGRPLGSHDLLGEGLSAPLERKKEAALALERALREDPRVKSVLMGGYLEREIRVALKSTQGAEGSFRTGFAALTGSFVMAQGKSVKQGWDFKAGKEFHALEPGRTALEFREKTARLLEARPLKTGRYRAYLEPRAMAMLLSVLAEAFSGKNAVEGKSRLLGRLGERIASPLVTLVDDPTLEKGLLSRPFDAEGTPTARTVVVEKGVFKTFLHNLETAKALGQRNTGHAARSYRGTLGVAPTNLYLEPVGNLALTDGVVVTEFMGLHAGANPVTLDFSLQALGLWVEEGEVRHAVENFAVSGNLLELLQAVEAVGDDLDWFLLNAAYGSPTVAVAELSFAGA